MRTLLIAFTILASFAFAAGTETGKNNPLAGTWIPETAEINGKPFPDEIRKSMKLVIGNDDTYTVTVGDKADKGTVKVNSTAKPKEIDIIGAEGPNKGKTLLAIYEHTGDTLRICYDLSGKARPTEFNSVGGTHFLVTYKREKK